MLGDLSESEEDVSSDSSATSTDEETTGNREGPEKQAIEKSGEAKRVNQVKYRKKLYFTQFLLSTQMEIK